MDPNILTDLLTRLASGAAYTPAKLALELDVDRDLLEQMLQDLRRAGYIREVETCCTSSCSGCAQEGLCRLLQGGRIWTLSDKGWRLVHAAHACSASHSPTAQ